MGQQYTQIVEERLGRKVVAYLSHVHTDPDVAVELFMLEPSDRRAVAEHEEEFPRTVEEDESDRGPGYDVRTGEKAADPQDDRLSLRSRDNRRTCAAERTSLHCPHDRRSDGPCPPSPSSRPPNARPNLRATAPGSPPATTAWRERCAWH
jgi:hypothetical protein